MAQLTDTTIYGDLNVTGSITGIGLIGRYVESFTTQTTVTVTHNLKDTSPNVIIYNGSNEMIEPSSVTVVDSNNITVTFGSSQSGKIVVQGGSVITSSTTATTNVLRIATMQPDGTSPPTSNFVSLNPSIDFDDSTDQIVYFSFSVPPDCDTANDMKAIISYCMAGANTSKAVVLNLDSNSLGDGVDTTPTTQSTTTETITVPDTAEIMDIHTATVLKIPSTNLSSGDVVSCKFYRDANSASDTATGDFQLLDFKLEYNI